MKVEAARDPAALAGLLQATARGDGAAFRALYDATSPKLFGIVLRIIGNRSMAEDVLQETYVRIWRKAESYAPEAGPPMPWLTVIARNRAIDRIRSEQVERSIPADEAMLDRLAAPSEGDPVTREALRRCLAGLDEEARSAVILAYCSGCSREELAERFRRPVGTIKTVLHRSLKQLKTCLDEG